MKRSTADRVFQQPELCPSPGLQLTSTRRQPHLPFQAHVMESSALPLNGPQVETTPENKNNNSSMKGL